MSATHDLYEAVRPGGVLGRCLEAISNPRKHRWNAYLRACRAIPKDSPVYGSTSFRRINDRRHDLIVSMFGENSSFREEVKESPEYQAVSKATMAWCNGPLIASTFLAARLLRRMEKRIAEKGGVTA